MILIFTLWIIFLVLSIILLVIVGSESRVDSLALFTWIIMFCLCVLTALCEKEISTYEHEGRIIEANIAEWKIDPKTGEKTLEYTVKQCEH